MDDHHITLEDVHLRFRMYSARNRSLKEVVVNTLARRKYGKPFTEVNALRGVSLHVPHGQRLGIVGDNGAGKSTMLKVISRIYPPTSGTIRCKGFLVPLLEVGIGFNFELSGLENIYLTGAIMGFPRKEMEKRVDSILAFSEMGDFADTPIKYYSSGMAQRLAFSIATDINPEILLLDEVFSVGDIHWMEKAKVRMQTLIDRSGILVLVSHDMKLIEEYCTRAVWLHGGRIAADGPPADIIAQYRDSTQTSVSAEVRHEGGATG